LPHAPASLDVIRTLIGFDTTSRESNLALISWVKDYLAEYGIASELTFDEDKRKANLFATVGPEGKSGIMLSGHTDVVPVDGQDWHSDPFKVVQKDGKLYGRGTSDMKSFIAIALALVPEMTQRRLATPLHFSLSYDEEVGCIGVRRLIRSLEGRPEKPRLCIVGEPTLMKPVTGHKGKRSFRAHVHGHECHSALSHIGVNAVEAAAEVVAFLKSLARRHRDHGPFDPDYSPPYTTVHTGTINGGTALNIVPKDCSFVFEFRHLPSDDADALEAEIRRFIAEKIEPEMKKVQPATGIELNPMSAFPALATPEDAEVTQLVQSLTGANNTGRVSFGTEAGLFGNAQIPAIVCGPGSIEQAHKPDEWIELEQIAQCEAFLRRLIDRVAA
jgi:acetylornithine deacetylase